MHFIQVALNSEIYVDKTGLLEYTNRVLNTKQGFICNSRPRRFGKSMTADMLTAYYSKGCDSKEMFSKLTISNSKDFQRHLNQYDVIHLDIQWFLSLSSNSSDVISLITQSILKELRENYSKELSQEVTTLPDALSCIKQETGQKFILIIDEWDVLIRDEAMNQNVQKEYIDFLRGILKGSEPTKYIQLAYLTGILPIKKIKTQSSLNNFDEFTMIDASNLAPFIGFTQDEVKDLCAVYDIDFQQVKRWYNGYILEDYQVYNPIAVVNVILAMIRIHKQRLFQMKKLDKSLQLQ